MTPPAPTPPPRPTESGPGVAIREIDGGIELAVKVVPGSSRDAVAGMLGDRLKVTVAAAAEGGKANKAVCALLARALGVAKRDVAVVAGQTQPRKTLRITGLTPTQAAERLSAH